MDRCRALLPVPGPLQTVQRAEFWGAIIALQSYRPCHLGIDNLNVARSIGRLLDHGCLAKPLPLIKDGDLIVIVQCMIRTRGQDTDRVTKVKGHATDDDVQQGRAPLWEKLGNGDSDAAADLGVRHQSELLVCCGRVLLNARNHLYPTMLQLHRFMIAISRVAVEHDGKGCSALDPLVWDRGRTMKVRKTDIRINVVLASLPGPCGRVLEWAFDAGSWWLHCWC